MLFGIKDSMSEILVRESIKFCEPVKTNQVQRSAHFNRMITRMIHWKIYWFMDSHAILKIVCACLSLRNRLLEVKITKGNPI